MLEFDVKYRSLPESKRIEIIKDIANTIEAADLTTHPTVRSYLETADGRLGLLRKLIDLHINSGWNIEKCISNLEHTTD